MLFPSLQTVFETPFSHMQNLMQYQTAIIIVVIRAAVCMHCHTWIVAPFSHSQALLLVCWFDSLPFFCRFLFSLLFACVQKGERARVDVETHTHTTKWKRGCSLLHSLPHPHSLLYPTIRAPRVYLLAQRAQKGLKHHCVPSIWLLYDRSKTRSPLYLLTQQQKLREQNNNWAPVTTNDHTH